jgi:hypothetical protein
VTKAVKGGPKGGVKEKRREEDELLNQLTFESLLEIPLLEHRWSQAGGRIRIEFYG